MSVSDFSTLPLQPALLQNLSDLGYRQMTPIQAQSLPPMLEGRDVIARARTGSGKTAAFALCLLAKLQVKRFCIQSLVLCPTRELADQVARDIRTLARGIHNIKVLTLCGGEPVSRQRESLHHGAHIIVGTPGRVLDHLQKQRLTLDALTTLVLDEADRMLDMGFQPDLAAIAAFLPRARQTLLFSATYPPQIRIMAADFMHQPIHIQAQEENNAGSIEQFFYQVDNNNRLQACINLLLFYRPEASVIFCNTRQQTRELAAALKQRGFSVQALHGDMEQRERDQALMQLANHSTSVLVATDVAARGLDISALDLVINYHIAHDADTHTHRIGRTGRAGEHGTACTLFSEAEQHKLDDLHSENVIISEIPDTAQLNKQPLTAGMVTLQIDGGKKQKIRPGDILGALTANPAIHGDNIGKIRILPLASFVAVQCELSDAALQTLTEQPMKGRMRRARFL